MQHARLYQKFASIIFILDLYHTRTLNATEMLHKTSFPVKQACSEFAGGELAGVPRSACWHWHPSTHTSVNVYFGKNHSFMHRQSSRLLDILFSADSLRIESFACLECVAQDVGQTECMAAWSSALAAHPVETSAWTVRRVRWVGATT